MKKLLSLALALVMCCCITLSACAVGTGETVALDSIESAVDTFANSAGDKEIKEACGTITLSNPILYTIPPLRI